MVKLLSDVTRTGSVALGSLVGLAVMVGVGGTGVAVSGAGVAVGFGVGVGIGAAWQAPKSPSNIQ